MLFYSLIEVFIRILNWVKELVGCEHQEEGNSIVLLATSIADPSIKMQFDRRIGEHDPYKTYVIFERFSSDLQMIY